MLTPAESFWLQWHANARQSSAKIARQASMLLKADAGTSPESIAAEFNRKPEAVTRLVQQFEAQRLALFPTPALFVDELLEAARVDMAHARHVAEGALTLFDATRGVHNLPDKLRALLETAALLHNVGMEVDAPKHHTAGRDVLMGMRLVYHTEAEQRLLACAVRFHRKRVRPQKEPLLATLPPRRQEQALALSALLRIADGLDYSQTQTTRIVAVDVTSETITLTLTGPHVEGDGDRAIEKSDLWTELFGHRWEVTEPPPDFAALAQTPLAPETAISTVAVRALADQLMRWRAAEPEAKAGVPLGIKNVRAAARRARAALDLFRPYFKKKSIKGLRRRLKQAEDALAPVRDWDVLIEEAQKEAGDQNWAFLDQWKAKRQAALAKAVRWLESQAAGKLQTALEVFLAEPPRKRKTDPPLKQAAESILLPPVDLIREYAAALDTTDLQTYHDLRRLAIKRCRFALEFLTPALGERAPVLLKELIRAQDRLGFLNDACVGKARLEAWLAGAGAEDEAARRYMLMCQAAIQKHLRKFERDWEAVRPERLQSKLLALLEPLEPEPLEELETAAHEPAI